MSSINLQHAAKALGGEVKSGQVLCPGPGHSAADRSLSVRIDAGAPEGFIVHSFAGDDPIECKDYVRAKCGLEAFKPNGKGAAPSTEDRIAKALAAAFSAPQSSSKPKGVVVATFSYTDENGDLLYQVLKYEPKNFSQRQPTGNGGWINNLDGVRRVLYRLPEILKFPDATMFVCEGEKDADRVASLGHCATTVASGKWTDECASTLAGRDILILEDNDEAGRKRAHEAATMLAAAAKTIRIVRLPGLTEKKKDVSDWLDADPRNADQLVDICFAAPLWEPESQKTNSEDEEPKPDQDEKKPKSAGDGSASAIALTFFGELARPTPKPWLIKNVIARGETSSWIAPPGRGKSALLTDISVHLGSGAYWRDYRTKEQCGVVYFALERADLVKRRLVAHKLRDNLPDLPIAVASEVIDLMNKSCVEVILATIAKAEQHFGCGVGLAVFDTYAKAIAAGGGDESQAKDQNIALANLRRVLDKVNIHIAGIGHTGKDESRGERGSNARLADVDVQVQITGDAVKSATVKEGE